MDSPRLSYQPRPETTAEARREALASIYETALETYRRQIEATPDKVAPNDAEKRSSEIDAKPKYTG